MARALESGSSTTKRGVIQAVTLIYLLVWVGAGLAAYVVGQMQHPGVLQPLTP